MTRRALRNREGFSLVETLAAAAIVGIGLVATAVAFQHAIGGVEAGRHETIAALLAEHKLEELKGRALADWTSVALQPGTTTEYCPADGPCSTTPTTDGYRRTTAVEDSPGGVCTARCKLVRITVFYRAVTGEGRLDQERRVDIVTMFRARA